MADVDSFLDPKLNCVKKVSKEFFKQYTDLDQLIALRITTLFSMYLILEINQHMQTLNDDKRSVWNKLEEFFAWNTHETELLKTKLQDSNTKFFGYGLLAITLVAKISLSMNASSFAFERSSNDFVFSLLFLALVALSLYLIFSSKKMSQLSAHAQHYTLDHIIHKFNEISNRSI